MIDINTFESLEIEARENGVDVIDYHFESNRIKGLYCNNVIGINAQIETSTEKACILAEELGHYHTSHGDIITLSNVQNRKQEHQARLWAYNKQIGLHGLIRAYEHGCNSRHETAEFLNVTEEFLENAIDCYREKYGVYTTIDNYTIYFIPHLVIGKKI